MLLIKYAKRLILRHAEEAVPSNGTSKSGAAVKQGDPFLNYYQLL